MSASILKKYLLAGLFVWLPLAVTIWVLQAAVALVLLVAGLMAGMVVAGRSLHGNGIDKAVADRIKETIGTVGAK